MSICSKDITIFNFIASFIWVEKSHISIEKHSTFVSLESVLNFLETVESKITGFHPLVSFDVILDILICKT